MPEAGQVVRVAALADIHYTKNSTRDFEAIFPALSEAADVVVICGDLTVHGHVEEASRFAHDLIGAIKRPIIVVMGNHDYESGQQDAIRDVLTDSGIVVLDGEGHEVQGIGFAGVKGFGGGFGRSVLEPWGEATIKLFVREAVDETLRLETALAKLRAPTKVVLTHYSPIRGTVEGEPPEIFPFLGCSRLEEPINRFEVAAAFHGHAHHGTPEGRTLAGVPVYNVAIPVLQRTAPDRPPFRVVELRVGDQLESGRA